MTAPVPPAPAARPAANAAARTAAPAPAGEGPGSGRTVVVAGGGIAGLTTALALAQRGFSVSLAERTTAFTEVGAGLQISPNAYRVLAGLGLDADLANVMTFPESVDLHGASGTRLARVPLGGQATARWGAPYGVLHRADLIAVLARAALASPAITVHTGMRALRAAPGPAGMRLETSGGPLDGEAVIAADGVWSQLRNGLSGAATARQTGRIAYRTTVPAEALPAGLVDLRVHAHMFPDAHVIRYPISGGRQINIVVVTASPWFVEDWSSPASLDEVNTLARTFDSDLQRLLAGATGWTRWPLAGVPADAVWNDAGLALIGDAAHATLPFAAQGAAMAIEDAAVLAHHLAAGRSVPGALAAYAAARRPRAQRIQALSEKNGQIYHMGALTALARDTALRLMSEDALMRRLDWLYGWRPPAGP